MHMILSIVGLIGSVLLIVIAGIFCKFQRSKIFIIPIYMMAFGLFTTSIGFLFQSTSVFEFGRAFLILSYCVTILVMFVHIFRSKSHDEK